MVISKRQIEKDGDASIPSYRRNPSIQFEISPTESGHFSVSQALAKVNLTICCFTFRPEQGTDDLEA